MMMTMPTFPRLLVLLPFFLAACSPTRLATPLELAEEDVATSYEDMMVFLQDLHSETGAFVMDTIGTSVEGRSLVALKFDGGEPESGDRLKVMVFAQQHGNEPSGREGLLTLARDLAFGDFQQFSHAIDLFLIPSVNPDGGEMEQRRNAEGFDLNRDHLPLFTPEVQAVHRFFREHMPEVTLDVHEYGYAGSAWVEAGFHKNFGHQIGAVSNPNIPENLRRYAVETVMPDLKGRLVSKNVELNRYLLTDGPDARVRYSTAALNDGRNSLGIYHTLSFLIEGQNGMTMSDDIRERGRKQFETVKAFVAYFAEHAEDVREMVGRERAAFENGQLPSQVSLVMDYVADPATPTLTYGVIDLASGEAQTREITDYHPTVETTLWVERPMGYAVPAELDGIIDVLRRHEIAFEVVEDDTPAVLETYTVDRVTETEKEDKAFLEVSVDVEQAESTIPAGSVVVWCDQRASSFIVTMLEPQAQWGLAPLPDFVWMLAEGSEFPIRRIVGQ